MAFNCLLLLVSLSASPATVVWPYSCDDMLRHVDPMMVDWASREEIAAMQPWLLGLHQEAANPLATATLRLGMSKALITCSWDEVPHLSAQAKEDMLKTYPPHMRDARSKGVPMLGSGAIYPVPETEITVADFPIPAHWKKCYGMDPGWNFTAAAWLAQDPDSQAIYLYSCLKQSKAEPSIHAASVKSRGDWIPGVIDPASAGANQVDGRRLIDIYQTLGLKLQFADNSVEAGLFRVWELLSSGQLKVFASCLPWFQEYRNYCRDEKGRIVKKDDHIMDAMRYAIMSGLALARAKAPNTKVYQNEFEADGAFAGPHMGGGWG